MALEFLLKILKYPSSLFTLLAARGILFKKCDERHDDGAFPDHDKIVTALFLVKTLIQWGEIFR